MRYSIILALSCALPSPAVFAQGTVQAPRQSAIDILPVPLNPIIPEKQRACSQKTSSGLGYQMLRAGSGKNVTRDSMVLVSYIGYLKATGEVFDQNASGVFPVDGVVPGFGEGLTLMQKGAIYRFCIPYALGYGEAGSGSIPAKADLVFQTELMDSATEAEIEAMQKAETEAHSTPQGTGEEKR